MAYGEVIEALADPTRRRIFELVARRPQAVGEVAQGVPVSRPAVSQHLRVLKDAGLVRERRDGTRRIYHAEPAGVAEVRAYFDHFWETALAAFAEAATKGGADDPHDD
jgi:DNA-binding transcriptional ArsR family regulator